jgi:hypothetical protein
MSRIQTRIGLPCILLFAQAVSAQDPMEPPKPAPELAKLAPFVGSWEGSGEAVFGPGAPPTKWKGHGTYRWSHDGHFLQEDFALSFEGLPMPMVMRSYLGWDRERKRYAKAKVVSSGRVELNEFVVLPSGEIYEMLLQHQQGQPYAERSTMKLDGAKLVHSIDLFLAEGDATHVVDATFARTEKPYEAAFDTAPFAGATAHDAMKQLVRMQGSYSVQGSMKMAAEMPSMKIGGVDSFRAVFGGTALHGHSDGTAEGMPGTYVSDVFFAHDEARGCLVGVAVSNMGEIMLMECRFTTDAQKLISIACGTFQGQPMAMRFVMEFDAQGVLSRGSGHTLSGAAEPFESFVATYAKK